MADSTPALARATEEVRQQDAAGPLMRTSVPTRTRAHAIVSAALHDPDDPDFGARELFVADSGQDRDFALRIWFEASDDQPVKQYWRRMFDALRAAILDFHAGPCDQPIQAHVADAVRSAILGSDPPQRCAWCDAAASGQAEHSDGRTYPSCGAVGHGLGEVSRG